MNNRYLVVLGAAGLVLGLASAFSWIAPSIELWAWFVLGAAALVLARRWVPDAMPSHLVFGMTVAAFVAADVRIVFWNRFLDGHPTIAAQVAEQGGAFRTSYLLSSTASGVFFGLLLAAIAYVWMRFQPMPQPED